MVVTGCAGACGGGPTCWLVTLCNTSEHKAAKHRARDEDRMDTGKATRPRPYSMKTRDQKTDRQTRTGNKTQLLIIHPLEHQRAGASLPYISPPGPMGGPSSGLSVEGAVCAPPHSFRDVFQTKTLPAPPVFWSYLTRRKILYT